MYTRTNHDNLIWFIQAGHVSYGEEIARLDSDHSGILLRFKESSSFFFFYRLKFPWNEYVYMQANNLSIC